jgi:hypothetical protein
MRLRPVLLVLTVALVGAPTAEAVTVRWKSDHGAAFQGKRCGDVDTVTWGLRRGAFRIRVERPTLGTLFLNDATGKVVARLTKIEVRRRGTRRSVRFSATGAGDVCTNPASYGTDGWSTEEIRFLIRYRTHEASQACHENSASITRLRATTTCRAARRVARAWSARSRCAGSAQTGGNSTSHCAFRAAGVRWRCFGRLLYGGTTKVGCRAGRRLVRFRFSY